MEYRVLGSLEVRSGGEIVALGPPKQRATLAILLLHAGEIIPTDRLIDLLWGDHPPRTANHSVQIYVSELRRALGRDGGAPPIHTRPPGYLLTADPETIDVRRFERLLAEAGTDLEAGDQAAATAALREALGLWRGPPLSDFAYDEFAQDEIRRLDALHVDALELLGAAELGSGRAQAAIASIDAAIAEDPLRERSRELQLQALYRSGRQPEALRAYEEFRALLSEELGVEPSPSLQRLQERVLLHDPSLVPAAAAIAVEAVPIRNPYKGLRAFGEDDVDDFFGREALVAELVTALARGTRLLALVGPSGSGKSSVIGAGLLPAIRAGALPPADRWVIARMIPGRQPFAELEAALQRAAAGGVAADAGSLLEADGRDMMQATRRILPDGSRLLLVIDQFEELFSFCEESTRLSFLRALTSAVTDDGGGIVVVLALRADFYDRPLLHPGFAQVFTSGVVNVVPLTADGLEAAIVRPAQSVGIDVDPALLARLTADTSDQPGALPLLEYTLAELFDRRAGPILALEDYRSLGGLSGALSRRAEELYLSLPEDRRQLAMQVCLRLVRLGEGARHSRRHVPVAELTALEVDPVALSEVLETFGRGRLLSFDRDPIADWATVEIAHEALLAEWERLATWIDRHRADLRQRDSLSTATHEWESSGRDPDYLLIGSRLAEFDAWRGHASLQLTMAEREFLEAGLERRRGEEAADAARIEQQRRLERRARSRLWAFLAAVALLAAVATFGVLSWLGSGPPDVVLLYEGSGDAGFGDMARDALDRAAADFGLVTETTTVSFRSNEVEAELRRISEEGVDLVIVGLGADATDVDAAVAADHPDTRYVVWENWGELPGNITNLLFRSEEGAYLAGAAAALTSRTGTVGFIGGWKVDIIDLYLAGYEAGARSIDPDIDVLPTYLAQMPDLSAFSSPQLGTDAATRLYSEGADVILAAAGSSGRGVFEAASSGSRELGKQLWAVGVDTDEYFSVLEGVAPEGQDPGAWQQHILTSVQKRLDKAFYTVLAEYARGSLTSGVRSFGLAEGGIDISYSGGFIDHLRPRLTALRNRIIAGEILVPTEPSDPVGTQVP